MNSKTIRVDEKYNVAPEVMFGALPAVLYEQDAGSADCRGIKHRHNEAQLSVVTEGQVRFVLADEERILRKGEAIFINCSRLHEVYDASEGSCKYLCLKFNPAAVSGGGDYGLYERYVEPVTKLSSQDALYFEGETADEVAGLIEEFKAVCEGGEPCHEIRINIILQKLWLIIFGSAETGDSMTHKASYSEKMRIDMLCDYIHNNYSEKITLDDIANAAHISKGECCRIFKRLFHTTPFQYLVYYRLSRSIELLTETDYSISQVAQLVGFCSSSYYTKCFRKEYNCVPHKYRQDLHKFKDPKENK